MDWFRALAERTAAVDALVIRHGQGRFTLAAVGGYGRRELFPYSDIDLLLLFPDDKAVEAAREPVAEFLQSLWDAGLRVSQQVRTLEECGELHEGNLELTISLLDHRFLEGDRELYAELSARLPRLLHARRDELVRRLARLTRERHARFQNTYYHLEPHLKDGPGGLRDLQLVRWLEQIRGRAGELPEELRGALAFLAQLRCLLHNLAGRDANVLTFENQEAAAEAWGEPDAARWMRQYFLNARAVARYAGRALEAIEGQTSGLLASFRDWRARLSNSDFSVSREHVYLRAPQRLEVDPPFLLQLYEFVARHGLPPALETEERIAARLPALAEWYGASRPVWGLLARLLALPHAPAALRAMHETGVLRAVLPELAPIECLVVRDFFHRYTVDEHSLVAVQTLTTLEGPFADLWNEIEGRALVIFALLFHDVGKASGAPHVEGSLRAAEAAMARIQMPPHDRETVRFLIREHLSMPAALRTRDLYDPATIEEMARRASTLERLKALTLVSYADVAAVNPTVMTPWRAGQLWQLYLLTHNQLTRALDAERIAGSAPFLEGFPTRYLRTHSEDELQSHLELERRSSARGVAAEVRRLDAAWRLTLVGRDRAFLFASVAGTLSAFGMNVLKAEAFSNHAGTVLDTFTFSDPHRTLELNPGEAERLRVTVERVVLGKVDVCRLLGDRPTPRPPSRGARVRSVAALDNQASPRATLIQIVAEDRPGLLYDLARAISSEGCNIDVVLIDTEAHKALDVFYVTAQGAKLSADACARLETALIQAIH